MIEAKALKRLNIGPAGLRIEDGECVSLMGRSGSGKSTLLRMIADLDAHDGETELDGHACSATPAPKWRKRVTYVAAESGWWDERVGAHFLEGAFLGDLFASVGLSPDVGAWPVARLSTGERQRLAVLRAFRPANRVLLLDEPTSGLDASSVAAMEAALRGRLARGTAILIVTHDREQALRLASRHLLIENGRLSEHRP
jgi:ABC-type multidrug transport system ATPase subunit